MAATQPAPLQINTFQRVGSIPLVNDSLQFAHKNLSTSPYTAYAYGAASSVSKTAYTYSQPLQVRLAPLIVRADGLANKGLDVVESRFPYPFHAPTEEVIGSLRSSSDHAYQTADKSLSPIIDKLELVVNKLSPQSAREVAPDSAAEGTEATKSQLGRAYKLTIDLKDQLYTLTGEQIRQVQGQSVIIQRATETVHNLNSSLISTYGAAKDKSVAIGKETASRVQALSQMILQELEKIQASTAALPAHLQHALQPLQTQISQTLTDLNTSVHSSGNASQKASQIAGTVQNQVGPLLEAVKETVGELVGKSQEKVQVVEETVQEATEATVNGASS